MNRIKKPAGREPTGKAGNGTKNSREFKRYCTPHTSPLSTPDYYALMQQARTPADYLAAFTSFLSEIEAQDG